MIAAYIIVMAGVTYLIRVIPFAAFRKKIRSPFVKKFLGYIPYAVLSAMTFPAMIFCTGNVTAGAVGTAAALILAYLEVPLIGVAAAASAAAFITSLLV